jgi:hypothetical protein
VWEVLVPAGGAFVNASGLDLTSVNGARLSDGEFAYLTSTGASSVPEPASLAVLGIGTTAIGLIRRRRDRCGQSSLIV